MSNVPKGLFAFYILILQFLSNWWNIFDYFLEHVNIRQTRVNSKVLPKWIVLCLFKNKTKLKSSAYTSYQLFKHDGRGVMIWARLATTEAKHVSVAANIYVFYVKYFRGYLSTAEIWLKLGHATQQRSKESRCQHDWKALVEYKWDVHKLLHRDLK